MVHAEQDPALSPVTVTHKLDEHWTPQNEGKAPCFQARKWLHKSGPSLAAANNPGVKSGPNAYRNASSVTGFG
jgi:hypothetical protein